MKKNIKKYKKLTIFLIFLGIVLGPVGNYQSFIFTKKIIGNTLERNLSNDSGHKIKIKN
jgi:hypothetical protein